MVTTKQPVLPQPTSPTLFKPGPASRLAAFPEALLWRRGSVEVNREVFGLITPLHHPDSGSYVGVGRLDGAVARQLGPHLPPGG